jgi:serine phosphatase RsbU (regulator of sigma subunit)/CBS domain-containing protein
MSISPLLTVRQMMVSEVVTAGPDHTIADVVRLMNQHRIGAVLIVGAAGLEGIFTERDFLRHALTAPPDWCSQPVSRWMTRRPHTIGPEATWEQARACMDRLQIRHMPVVENGAVVGMVTVRDIMGHANDYLNSVIAERTAELREANERLSRRDAELTYHMAVAGKIQSRLLPDTPPSLPEIAWAALYEPLDPLGGDYYDFAAPTPQHLGVVIADATGHSIPAALIALLTRTAFALASRGTVHPGQVLKKMNQLLYGISAEHFVTAFYAVFDRSTRTLSFANAGHPNPYVLRAATGKAEPLASRGLMLGIMEQADYQEHAVALESGDRLLFYTDGLPDCRNPQGEYFGTTRLVEVLQSCGQQSAEAMVRRFAECLEQFRGSRPPSDDLTILTAVVH